MRGFSYTPEFGWFVCGAMVASAFDNGADRDWVGAVSFGLLSVVLLVMLIRDRRSRHAA